MKYFRERRTVILIALAAVLITTLPYLVGFQNQDQAWRFSGFIIGVEDGNSYLAKMLAGAAGDWLFRSPYSAEPQRGVIAFLPYLLIGKLAAGPARHEQLLALYQIFRAGAVFLAVLATSDFISLFLRDQAVKDWALALSVFGGGLGWVLVLLEQKHFLGSIPLEFLSPESFGFLGLFGFPHLAVSRALLLWGMVAYLKGKNGSLAGLLWLGMGYFQPLAVGVAWAVIAAHSLLVIFRRLLPGSEGWASGRFLKEVLLKPTQAYLVSMPILAYTGVQFLTDPYLRGWAEQNLLPSPAAVHYLIAYGVMLPLVIPGLRSLYQLDQERTVFLAGWLISLPILIYAPVSTQRRLAEGAWVVIVTSALAAFSNGKQLGWRWKAYLGLAFPSTLILLAGACSAALYPAKPVFRPAGEVAVYRYLEPFSEKRPVILASYEISNNIPAWVPVRVVLGHGPESIHRAQIETDLAEIFSDKTEDAQREQLLAEYQVDFLVWGPEERNSFGWDPQTSRGLKLIYNQGEYAIFEVTQND